MQKLSRETIRLESGELVICSFRVRSQFQSLSIFLDSVPHLFVFSLAHESNRYCNRYESLNERQMDKLFFLLARSRDGREKVLWKKDS